jgi:hypothetical protein
VSGRHEAIGIFQYLETCQPCCSLGGYFFVFFLFFEDCHRGGLEDQDLTPLGEVYDLHIPGYGYLVSHKLVGILYGRHIYLGLQDVACMLLSGIRTRALELSFEVGHGRSPFRVSGVDIVPSFANEDRAIVFCAGHCDYRKCFWKGWGLLLVNQECARTRLYLRGAKPYKRCSSDDSLLFYRP